MPCQHYKDALIDTAASDAQPQGDLRAHLANCDACRATFAQEQALFSSIDAGLHVTATAKVPASLLPRVCARLDEVSVPRRTWVANWLVLATATGVLVTLLAARAVWRTNVVQKPVETAEKTSVPPRVTPPPQKQDLVVVPPVEKNSDSQHQLAVAKKPKEHETPLRAEIMPEVLVPRGEEVLLAEYAAQWRLHARAPLLAQDADSTVLVPLQVAQIQIAQLDVKLLAEQHPQ
jgi:hypothetical protein